MPPPAALTGTAAWPGEQAPRPAAARVRRVELPAMGPVTRTCVPGRGRCTRVTEQGLPSGAGMPTFRSQQVGCGLSRAQGGAFRSGQREGHQHMRARGLAAWHSGTPACPPTQASPQGRAQRPVACLSIRTDDLGRDIAQRVVGTRARAHEQEEPRTLGIRKLRYLIFPHEGHAPYSRGLKSFSRARAIACSRCRPRMIPMHRLIRRRQESREAANFLCLPRCLCLAKLTLYLVVYSRCLGGWQWGKDGGVENSLRTGGRDVTPRLTHRSAGRETTYCKSPIRAQASVRPCRSLHACICAETRWFQPCKITCHSAGQSAPLGAPTTARNIRR